MRCAFVFLGLLTAAPAWAADGAQVRHAQAPHHNPLDCYCRAQGRMFAPGERVCLKTAEGSRLAECRMEINVMSWSITASACPET
jgi:hypothetical protein